MTDAVNRLRIGMRARWVDAGQMGGCGPGGRVWVKRTGAGQTEDCAQDGSVRGGWAGVPQLMVTLGILDTQKKNYNFLNYFSDVSRKSSDTTPPDIGAPLHERDERQASCSILGEKVAHTFYPGNI
uniref:Uncharacterized protein n=1 Tax=Romanomermis culicivorax TaxID=13658 RepID=A0A915HRU1_ROMCU